MSTFTKLTTCLSALLWIIGGNFSTAQIIGASSNPNGPSVHVNLDQIEMSHPAWTGPPTFLWGDSGPSGSIPIAHDPSSGPVDKWLTFAQDQDENGTVDENDFNAIFAAPSNFFEYLTVGSGSSWTDWHEVILTPGWEWANNPSLTSTTHPINPTVQTSGASVDFYFDPLPSGAMIVVDKQLTFTGDINDPAIRNPLLNNFYAGNLMVQVQEYPTVPEPSSLSLFLISAVSMSCLGKRAHLRSQALD